MKGIINWNHTPYAPLNAPALRREFFICQIQPFESGFSLSFRDSMPFGHTVLFRIRGEISWQEVPAFTLRLRLTDQENRHAVVRNASQ